MGKVVLGGLLFLLFLGALYGAVAVKHGLLFALMAFAISSGLVGIALAAAYLIATGLIESRK